MSLDSRSSDSVNTDLATTVGLYALGELTLGEAADRAEVSEIRMQEILAEAGVELRLGPETKDEARREVDVARRATE
ncbi:UPF0175 family protein [Halorussus amylolyticus]|uniref:UPF0175 family protein n=1 Tax=Halorussus amylolyticus TaxID=1126242 RepID=UPI001051918C|nr:UPF0175 family protein [Halorussus amylolyticus]